MSNYGDPRGPSSPWGEPLPAMSDPAPSRSAGRRYPPAPQDERSWDGAGGPTAALHLPARRDWEPGRWFRAARASVALLVISLGLGLALASALGLLFWALASAIHHASS